MPVWASSFLVEQLVEVNTSVSEGQEWSRTLCTATAPSLPTPKTKALHTMFQVEEQEKDLRMERASRTWSDLDLLRACYYSQRMHFLHSGLLNYL